MQTIHIDVKDSYAVKVIAILQSLQGIMLDKIHVDKKKPSNDKEELQDSQEPVLNVLWDNDEDKAWNDL